MSIRGIDKANLNVANLNLLIVFDALYQEQNVTRAGERIGLAQPSVSSALNRLRVLMKDELFVRKANKMIPTPRAEQLAEPVTQALFHASRALSRELPFDVNNPGERQFTIAVSDYSGLIVLPKLIGAIRSQSPKLKFAIQRLDRSKLDRQFQSREVDIAVGGHLRVSSDTVLESLFTDRFVCIRRRSQIARPPISIKSYLEADHVMFRSHSVDPVPCVVDRLLELKSQKRNVVSGLPHISSVPFVVAESEMIATISEKAAQLFSDLAPIEICDVPIDGLSEFDISFQCSSDIEHDKSLQWMRDLALSVTERFRQTPTLPEGCDRISVQAG